METTKPTPMKRSVLLTEYYGTVFFAIVLIFLAAGALVLKPMLDSVKATNAEISSQLVAVDHEQAYLNSLERSISAAKTIPPNVLGEVDQALPRENKIPELLVLLGQTAERDGVRVTNVSFSQPHTQAKPTNATAATISDLTVNLTVDAIGYPQIKRYLHDLEASLRLLDVIGINVSTQGALSSYAIQLKSYVFVPPVKAAVTPTPTQH